MSNTLGPSGKITFWAAEPQYRASNWPPKTPLLVVVQPKTLNKLMNHQNPLPTLVNKAKLAIIFGKSITAVDGWIRRGMPHVKKGDKSSEWQFDTAAVADWREEQAVANALANSGDIEIEEARRRKLAAEAAILEIELEQKRRQVITYAEVEQGLVHAFLTIKQRLRTIPERIIAQIMGENDEQYARELLLNEIDDALLELSQLDFDAAKAE